MDAGMVVLDVTDPSCFEKIAFWMEQIRHTTNAPFVIVGNRACCNRREGDRAREVSYEEGLAFAREIGELCKSYS